VTEFCSDEVQYVRDVTPQDQVEAADDGADARRPAAQPQLRGEGLPGSEATSPDDRRSRRRAAPVDADLRLRRALRGRLLSSLRRDAGTGSRGAERHARQR